MKKYVKLLLLLLAIASISGCLGELSGTAWSPEEKTMPYIEKWQKAGITPEQRREDSVLCGSNKKAKYQPHFEHTLREMKFKSDQERRKMRSQLHRNWQRCMLKKGYRYMGKCYDNEISKASPACGAP